mgnify:CR=1 FL=1
MTGRKRESALESTTRTLGSRMALVSERPLKRLRLKKSAARTNMMMEVSKVVVWLNWAMYESVRL